MEKQPVSRLGHSRQCLDPPAYSYHSLFQPCPRPDLIGDCDLRIHDIIRILLEFPSDSSPGPRFFLQCG